jgi:hypothetical protein
MEGKISNEENARYSRYLMRGIEMSINDGLYPTIQLGDGATLKMSKVVADAAYIAAEGHAFDESLIFIVDGAVRIKCVCRLSCDDEMMEPLEKEQNHD